MSLIHNERTKRQAAALDRSSTACLAVGVLGQALELPGGALWWTGLITPASWILAAIALHWTAWTLLGRLRQ